MGVTNILLAVLALTIWSAAYLWFFWGELRHWRRWRNRRRQFRSSELAQARAAYAAWVRNIPPPRDRRAIMPPPVPPLSMPGARGGVVVPFPRRARGR